MSQPKLIQFLFMVLFIGIVTVAILFLVSVQLNSFMRNANANLVVTSRSALRVTKVPLQPTPTMYDLTLDMLATLQPTATFIISTTAVPSPQAALLLKASTSAGAGRVNTDLVNIRSYPGIVGEVVGQARVGTELQILEKSNDGQWLHVCCPLGNSETTIQSWISAEFVDITSQPTNPAVDAGTTLVSTTQSANPGDMKATVTSALANVRNGPDTNYSMVTQLAERTEVTINGRNEAGTWWRLCCLSATPGDGWISAEVVSLAVPQAEAMAKVPVVAVGAIPTPIPTSLIIQPTPTVQAP